MYHSLDGLNDKLLLLTILEFGKSKSKVPNDLVPRDHCHCPMSIAILTCPSAPHSHVGLTPYNCNTRCTENSGPGCEDPSVIIPYQFFLPSFLAALKHTFYASAVPQVLSCMCWVASHAFLSNLDSMSDLLMDFLSVKKRAGSERCTQCREGAPAQPAKPAKSTCPPEGRAGLHNIQSLCSFMFPFLCTWCYSCWIP